MYLVFFLLWVLYNGRITLDGRIDWQLIVIGALISAAVYWFFCKFLGYNPKTDRKIVRNFINGVRYVCLLLVEVAKATWQVLRLVLSPRIEIEPVLIYFRTDLKSDLSKVVLANSITLTPGTITCNLSDDGVFSVHCLDESMADGIAESSFVQLLRKMEETV